MIGPPLGSVFYGLYGYDMTFYIFSIFFLYNFIILYIFLPDKLNYDGKALIKKRNDNNVREAEAEINGDISDYYSERSSSLKSFSNVLDGYNLLKIKELSIIRLLTVKGTFFSTLAQALAFYNVSFYDSFISIRI